MITLTLILIAGLISLALMYYALRGQAGSFKAAEDLEAYTLPIDLAAFQNLMDSEDQKFLRARLRAANYRKVQKKRIRACIFYVRRCAKNAAVLIRLGESAAQDVNPEIRFNGRQMVNEALRMRVFALLALPKLYFSLLFPHTELSLAAVCNRYARMALTARNLARMQGAAFVSRVFSSL